ncbi:MAG: aldo/keto reductase, partial [Hyphomicrobiales bacterium]
GGLLTGKYTRNAPPPEDSRFAAMNADNPFAANYRRRWTERVFDAVEQLEPLAASKGVSLSQYALAWVMNQPGVTSAIIGPRTMEQLEDNLKAIDVEITPDDRAAIDAVVPPGNMVSPFYEADFGPSKYRW